MEGPHPRTSPELIKGRTADSFVLNMEKAKCSSRQQNKDAKEAQLGLSTVDCGGFICLKLQVCELSWNLLEDTCCSSRVTYFEKTQGTNLTDSLQHRNKKHKP